MVSRPTITTEQLERVRARIREFAEKVHGGNMSAAARAFDIKPPSLHKIMNWGAPSYQTCQAIARVLGIRTEELLDGPQPSAPTPTVTVPLERYPTRGAAVTVWRSQQLEEEAEDPELVEEAIGQVSSTAHDSDEDPGAAFWMRQLSAALRDAKRRRREPPRQEVVVSPPAEGPMDRMRAVRERLKREGGG